MSFLNLFTGRTVRGGGLVLAAASSVFLSNGHRVGYLIALMVGLISWTIPELWAWLSNFADEKYWPTFVSAGVAILFAAHNGGLPGLFACCGPLAIYDGMYFDENY